jgi:hypothetical protein
VTYVSNWKEEILETICKGHKKVPIGKGICTEIVEAMGSIASEEQCNASSPRQKQSPSPSRFDILVLGVDVELVANSQLDTSTKAISKSFSF